MDASKLYQSLIEGTENLEIKGAANKYTSMNGNMFSFMTKEGQIALRLSKESRESFLVKHPDSVCIQYNTVMKDYVLVPGSIMKSKSRLKKLFDECVANAATLKPKPTVRKKK